MESKTRVFKFKKVDWSGRGRKINQPEVIFTIKHDDNGKIYLDIVGAIWNGNHRSTVYTGCLSEMKKFESIANDPLFNKLYEIWTDWNLKCHRGGTIAQESALKDYRNQCKQDNIVNLHGLDADVAYLKSIGLYNDNGYVYGTSWWQPYEASDADLKSIDDLFYN